MIEHILSYQGEILKALRESALLIGIPTLGAVLLGLPLGTILYTSKEDGISPNRILNFLGNLYVNVVRSFPFLIFVVAMIPITRLITGRFLGTIPATVPLTFVFIALFARLVEQSLLEVPQEIVDTGLAMGASQFQLVFKFLYVEARSSLVLSLTSSMISIISYSTVMGVVGGGGIGDFAMRYGYQQFDYILMYTIVVIMILSVQFIQFTGSRIAQKLDKR